MNTKNVLSVLALHLLSVVTIAYYPLSAASLACFVLLYWITGCLGISLGYHRLLSHRSFGAPLWVERLLGTCGALALQLGPSRWVYIHRNHHSHSDTDNDPHSPVHRGFLWGYALWLFSKRPYHAPVSPDRYYRFLDKYYAFLQLPLFALLYLVGGMGCALWGTAVRICFVWHLSWANNALAHSHGARAFNTADNSRNNFLLAMTTFGEGWHNNHHAFPYSARIGLLPGQIDIGWMHIRALEALGLAMRVKHP